jgi:hypothetical protein
MQKRHVEDDEEFSPGNRAALAKQKCERLDLLDGVEDQSAEADFAAPEK